MGFLAQSRREVNWVKDLWDFELLRNKCDERGGGGRAELPDSARLAVTPYLLTQGLVIRVGRGRLA